jgi:hypothetical protein
MATRFGKIINEPYVDNMSELTFAGLETNSTSKLNVTFTTKSKREYNDTLQILTDCNICWQAISSNSQIKVNSEQLEGLAVLVPRDQRKKMVIIGQG